MQGTRDFVVCFELVRKMPPFFYISSKLPWPSSLSNLQEDRSVQGGMSPDFLSTPCAFCRFVLSARKLSLTSFDVLGSSSSSRDSLCVCRTCNHTVSDQMQGLSRSIKESIPCSWAETVTLFMLEIVLRARVSMCHVGMHGTVAFNFNVSLSSEQLLALSPITLIL